MSRQEAAAQYNKALKRGRRCYKSCVLHGRYPYPQVLDEILGHTTVAGQAELGIVEIPSKQIVGTKTAGRRSAFAADFMPLLDGHSEFADKWISLCEAHLGDEGIRDPIRCYEYMGRFYVQEGNKRVSVLRSFDAPDIPGHVIRIIPEWSEDPAVLAYYDFLEAYQKTGLYQVYLSRQGDFAKLQAALGYEPGHVWTEEERRRFIAGYTYFQNAFQALDGEDLPITVADALLVWLKVYPFRSLNAPAAELQKTLEAVWPDIRVLARPDPISVSTDTQEEAAPPAPGLLGRLFAPAKHLDIAFIHEYRPERSDWIRGHDLGRQYLEAVLGDRICVQNFYDARPETAEQVMEVAVRSGAQLLFATTPSLIGACRKTAASHPEVRVLNCSISMPYTGVRTYYDRIYEGKFITGAIAGALSKGGPIGYVASAPIFGVPASINAFALGAQMTAPGVRICLRWSCVEEDPMGALAREGIPLISNRDVPTPDRMREPWGLCRVEGDGSFRSLASPCWHWGHFYVKLVESILTGSWDALSAPGDRAVNYWWGMRSETTGVLMSEDLPEGVRQLADWLRQGVIQGTVLPFHRTVRAQDGTIRCDGRRDLSPEEILHMDWLCGFVDGSIPAYEELLPMARSIVRLQGIYRHRLAPEKEGTIL